MIGLTVEIVVSESLFGLTRLPICARAIPAMPSIGEVILVKPRLSWAAATPAFAASMVA